MESSDCSLSPLGTERTKLTKSHHLKKGFQGCQKKAERYKNMVVDNIIMLEYIVSYLEIYIYIFHNFIPYRKINYKYFKELNLITEFKRFRRKRK